MTAATLALAFASLVVHEYAHGWVAFKLGDTTARNAGRLTLNPLAHVNLVMTLLLPMATMLFSGGTMAIGGGKPVPVNRYALRYGWRGYLLVVLAGPAVNAAICLVCWLLGFRQAALVNAALALFNVLPIPGFDGWNAGRALSGLWRERRLTLS